MPDNYNVFCPHVFVVRPFFVYCFNDPPQTTFVVLLLFVYGVRFRRFVFRAFCQVMLVFGVGKSGL